MKSFVWSKVFRFHEGRWWKKLKDGQKHKLRDAPMASPWTFKKTQASKLGDAQGIPSSLSTTIMSSPLILCFYDFTYYELFLERHFILLSVCFAFFAGHMQCWIISILFGRETRSAFSLEYSCASLVSCWVILAIVFLISSCASLISF